MSSDVNDPGARTVTFDQVYAAYREQALALHEGGVDLFLIETIFDTLNAKAAIKAILDLEDEGFEPLPIWISGTITDRSGRTLSGQTVEAFWNSVRHARPFAVGPQLRAGRRADAPAHRRAGADRRHPGRGLSQRRPAQRHGRVRRGAATRPPACSREWARSGLVNILGGCCGTTPDHIRHIAERGRRASDAAPRSPRAAEARLRLRRPAKPFEAGAVTRKTAASPRRGCRRHSRARPLRPSSSTSASGPTSPARRASAS